MMKQRRQLIENIFSMVTLRGMEYVLAFLLVPYLLRTLGPETTVPLLLCRELSHTLI